MYAGAWDDNKTATSTLAYPRNAHGVGQLHPHPTGGLAKMGHATFDERRFVEVLVVDGIGTWALVKRLDGHCITASEAFGAAQKGFCVTFNDGHSFTTNASPTTRRKSEKYIGGPFYDDETCSGHMNNFMFMTIPHPEYPNRGGVTGNMLPVANGRDWQRDRAAVLPGHGSYQDHRQDHYNFAKGNGLSIWAWYGRAAPPAITAETPAVPNESVSLHVTRSEGGKEGGGGGGGNDLSGTYYSVERSNGTPNGDRYEFRLEGDHYYIIRPPGGQKKEDDYFTFDGTTGYHCKGPKNTLLRNGDLHWDLDGGKWVSRPQEGGGGAHAKGAVTLSGFSGYNSRLNGEYNPDGDSVSGKPVYTHMHHEGVGAGHNWCRMWYAHGAWRIGHVSWVHGDNALAVAFVKSGAALPGQIEPSANWMEHKGHGAGHDYGKDERHFRSAGKVVISGGAQAGGAGGALRHAGGQHWLLEAIGCEEAKPLAAGRVEPSVRVRVLPSWQPEVQHEQPKVLRKSA